MIRIIRGVILALLVCFSVSMTAQKKQASDDTLVFTPQWMAQAQFAGYYVAMLYMFHGMTVSCIDKTEPNSPERRAAYNCAHAS